MKKGFTIFQVVVVVAIIALLAGVYYLNQKKKTYAGATTITGSSNETANWKAYTNNTYGISFEYPNDWQVTADPAGNIDLTDTQKEYRFAGSKISPITIMAVKDTFDGSIDRYVASDPDLKDSLQKETTTIGGVKAYIIKGKEASGEIEDYKIVFHGGYVFDFVDNAQTIAKEDPAANIEAKYTRFEPTVSFK